MGDLVLKGATSGQITITPTGVAGTNTLTLPAKTGNIITSADSGTVTQAMLASGVVGNGPAFSAYQSSTQSISSGTWTKVQLQTEEFDTANCFDSTTNYRFTPTVAGYYQVNGGLTTGGLSANYFLCAVYKNSSLAKQGSNNPTSASGGPTGIVAALIYLNGSTDYVELYGLSGTTFTTSAAGQTYFQAFLARSA